MLLAVAGKSDIDPLLLTKLASGFCSGMARTSGMCGAITGGILALNLVLGRETPSDSIEENYKAVQKLIEKFEKRFCSTNCTELLHCDLGTDEGQERFRENELFNRCREFTSEAASITIEILKEAETEGGKP